MNKLLWGQTMNRIESSSIILHLNERVKRGQKKKGWHGFIHSSISIFSIDLILPIF